MYPERTNLFRKRNKLNKVACGPYSRKWRNLINYGVQECLFISSKETQVYISKIDLADQDIYENAVIDTLHALGYETISITYNMEEHTLTFTIEDR